MDRRGEGAPPSPVLLVHAPPHPLHSKGLSGPGFSPAGRRRSRARAAEGWPGDGAAVPEGPGVCVCGGGARRTRAPAADTRLVPSLPPREGEGAPPSARRSARPLFWLQAGGPNPRLRGGTRPPMHT